MKKIIPLLLVFCFLFCSIAAPYRASAFAITAGTVVGLTYLAEAALPTLMLLVGVNHIIDAKDDKYDAMMSDATNYLTEKGYIDKSGNIELTGIVQEDTTKTKTYISDKLITDLRCFLFGLSSPEAFKYINDSFYMKWHNSAGYLKWLDQQSIFNVSDHCMFAFEHGDYFPTLLISIENDYPLELTSDNFVQTHDLNHHPVSTTYLRKIEENGGRKVGLDRWQYIPSYAILDTHLFPIVSGLRFLRTGVSTDTPEAVYSETTAAGIKKVVNEQEEQTIYYPVTIVPDTTVVTQDDVQIAGEVTTADPTPPGPGPSNPDSNVDKLKFPLSDFFPFCIPFDLYAFFSCLSADPAAPVFDWPIYNPLGENIIIHVDLSKFDALASIFRKGQLLLFIVGLGLITRSKILHS